MKSILLILFLGFSTLCFSQLSKVKQRVIDSLYPVASNHNNSVKERLEAYSQCCWASAYQDFELCLKISNEYEKLASVNKNYNRQIMALHFQGHSFMMLGSLDSAEVSFKTALKRARKNELFSREAEALGDLGNLMMTKGNVNQALKFHQKCNSVATKNNNKVECARSNINIGEILESTGDYKQSLKAFQKALAISEENEYVGFKSSIHEKLGAVHFTIGENDLAEEHYRLSNFFAIKHPNIGRQVSSMRMLGDLYLSMNVADSAMSFYQKALTISRSNKMLIHEASSLAGIAIIHKVNQQMDSAKLIIEQSLNLFQDQELNEDKANALYNAGEIYHSTGSVNLAINSLLECYKAALDFKNLLLQEKSSALLADLYNERGNFKFANEFYKKTINLKERRRNQDEIKDVIRLNIQSEYKVKTIEDSLRQINELAIIELKHNQFKEREKNVKQLIYLGIGALLIILGFLLYSLVIRRKRAKLLSHKNKIITGALNDKEILLKEVHHRVKNNMQVVSSLLQLKSRSTRNSAAKEVLIDSQKRIESMQLAHQKMYKNNNFEQIEIIEYVNDIFSMMLDPIKQEKDTFVIKSEDQIYLDVEKAQALGFVVHELVMNSIKYAWPNEEVKIVELVFYKNNKSIRCRYSDNGIGLKEELEFDKIESFGLKMINSLITKQLLGVLEIEKSQGFNLNITFSK
jgi:two-component sensor histidine kinase/Tfp pilus assembly protein PilF